METEEKMTMKRILFGLAIVGALVFGNGCASTRQFVPLPDQSKRVENPEQSRIYVMRPAVFGGAIQMGVRDGEKLIGSTVGQSFLCWERDPGKTTISSKAENTSNVELDTQKGSVYYLIQHVCMGIFIARNKLELVDQTEGQQTLQKCKPPTVTTAK